MHQKKKLQFIRVICVVVRFDTCTFSYSICHFNVIISIESFRELYNLHIHFTTHPTADEWIEKQSAHDKAAIILTRVLQIEGK